MVRISLDSRVNFSFTICSVETWGTGFTGAAGLGGATGGETGFGVAGSFGGAGFGVTGFGVAGFGAGLGGTGFEGTGLGGAGFGAGLWSGVGSGLSFVMDPPCGAANRRRDG